MPISSQLCTFFLDSQMFGIDVQTVQEVIRYQQMTDIPLAPDAVCGLINLRGQIVTAIDLRKRLGLPSRPEGQLPMNVVVRSDDGAVSLLVDQIGDVQESDLENFASPPETLRGGGRTTDPRSLQDERSIAPHPRYRARDRRNLCQRLTFK
ncbi:MAG: chemotaxis protein CheW [Pirellula sp.]